MVSKKNSSPKKEEGGKRKREQVDSADEQGSPDSNAIETKDEVKEETKDDVKEEAKEDVKDEGEDERPTKVAKTSSVLDWLLSDEAFDLANPEIPKGHGEIDWEESERRKTPPDEQAGKSSKESESESILRYPRSKLTPFQNLVSASILSKPLSHKLGLRTIQTLLNPPFSIRTWKDLDEAGYEGRRKIMWEARTQHKEKTASLLGDLCDGIKELCGQDEDDLSQLQGVRDEISGLEPKEAQDKVEEILTKIKGIGPGVASIFLRRVQGDWEEVFPYIDDKTLKAAKAFGLVSDGGAEELKDKVKGDRDKYVRVVDVLVGLELEKKVEEALERARA